MRYAKLTKLGSPRDNRAEAIVPYNGELFEFLDPDWRALARRAAAREGGIIREGSRVVEIFDRDE